MKKLVKITFYTILVILIMRYVISPAANAGNFPNHICIDKTHKTCDGACECDGMGCNVNN
jgi:hypothetical protein